MENPVFDSSSEVNNNHARVSFSNDVSSRPKDVRGSLAGAIRPSFSKTGMTYSWQNINVYGNKEPSKIRKHIPFCNKGDSVTESKHIIQDVTGIARPGELLAIMGASGAGKTTLLNVLTCRNTGQIRLSGERKINGQSVDRTLLASVSAYIQQSDIFIGTLTPREHLLFQATLRMDRNIPMKKRKERVEEVLQEMGLTGCADTIIGIPGRIKGLSGGQQKRLSIATEILTDPSILFCDEPTTGLDSFMALSVVKALKELSAKGKTVICTIHQPSSEVFSMYDRLLLMSEGRTAFLGNRKDAVTLFGRMGEECPITYNPADFFIFTLAIRPGREAECLKRAGSICDGFKDSEYASELQNLVRANAESSGNAVLNQQTAYASPYKASWFTQFSACLGRSWKTVMKDPLVLKIQLAQSVFLALVIGVVFLGQDMDQEGIQNINGFLFMMLANLTFSSIFPVANVFWDELPVFMREHYNGTYRTDAYYLGKTMAELPVYLLVPIVFTSISYWMVGLNSDVDRFFIAMCIAVLITNVACSYGYMIATVSSSLDMALAMAPVFIMPFMLFGGSLLNKDSIPVYFIWLKYLSWFLHGNEALSVNQWKGVQNISCPNEEGLGCIPNGDLVLETLSFKEDNFGLALGVLGALIVATRILAYVGLWAKTRKED